MICNMGLELKLGQMVQGMKGTIKKGKSMEKEPIHGAMGPSIMEIGMIIRSMVLVFTHG